MPRRVANPASPYQSHELVWEGPAPVARLVVQDDPATGILSRNRDPRMPFGWSVNPYRGCTHACAYCYARAYHEFLGLGAGTDFETRLFVKRGAPELLRAAFLRPSWAGERVAFSGATDCYQPLERRLGLTRRCLEVCLEFRSPVSLITRSALVLRDLDLLCGLAQEADLRLSISLPVLDRRVAQALEPGAPLPTTRLDAVRVLAEAGLAVGISVAPVLPGLTDHELPAILAAARAAGAVHARMDLVRLQGRVGAVFAGRLRERLGERVAAKVMGRVERLRGPDLAGPVADDPGWRATQALFRLHHDRLGFRPSPPEPPRSSFCRPGTGHQLGLFGPPSRPP